VTVSAGYLLASAPAMPPNAGAWQAVMLLTMVTLISRLSLFMGLKRLGGVQTALIGLSELLVTVFSAFLLLGEKLSGLQWVGAALLAASILLVARESQLGTLPTPRPWTPLLFGQQDWHAASRPPAEPPAEPDRPPKPAPAPPHPP
jgi:drug/metabolite transporter (DMT)-like permease